MPNVRHCLFKHAHIFCFILCFCVSRPGSAKCKGPGNLFIFPLLIAPDESVHANFAELFHQFLKFLQKRVADQETGSCNCSAIKMIFWSVSAAAYLEQESCGSCSSQIEPRGSDISPDLITITIIKKMLPFFPHLPSGFLIDEPSHLNRVLEIALKYTTTSWNIFVKESCLLKFWS